MKDDPELKHVFEDIQSSGAEVMEKYWCVPWLAVLPLASLVDSLCA